MVEFEIYNGDVKVSYEMTEDKKDRIISEIMKYVKKHDCVDAEHLMQDDDCLIEAPEVLSDILEIFDFKTIWK